jgi:hypothetical protein
MTSVQSRLLDFCITEELLEVGCSQVNLFSGRKRFLCFKRIGKSLSAQSLLIFQKLLYETSSDIKIVPAVTFSSYGTQNVGMVEG